MTRKKNIPDQEIFDMIAQLRNGKSLKDAAKSIGITKREGLQAIEEAFDKGIVSVQPENPGRRNNDLIESFKPVQFSIISASKLFDQMAAEYALRVIKDIVSRLDLKPNQEVFIAIGGGEAMHNLAFNIEHVLRNHSDIREWFSKPKYPLHFINATAGGQPTQPESEASFLTTYIASILKHPAGIFSVSTTLSEGERSLINRAVSSPAIVLSGVGVPSPNAPAYCFQAMREKGVLDDRTIAELSGEFLYHPIREDGELWGLGHGKAKGEKKARALFDIKETARDLHSAGSNCDGHSPMFATLFAFEGMQGRPAHAYSPKQRNWTGAPRHVIGVVKDKPASIEYKARILRTLLDKNVFTHLIISSELGHKILTVPPRRTP